MGAEEIDEAYVLAPEHRPSQPHDAHLHSPNNIPVIDLAPLQPNAPPPSPAALDALIAAIGFACEEWGFFQVINHSIPLAVIHKLHNASMAFFHLPHDEKLLVKRNFDNGLGYNDGELTKNVRDWKEMFDMCTAGSMEIPINTLSDDPRIHTFSNRWPASLPLLREACEEYASEAEKLSYTLLELISQSLGLQPKHFHDQFANSKTSRLRLNYYPTCPHPELVLGVSRHKDVGALTVLFQDDVGGLEVRRKDGVWVSVKPDPTAPVINIGDLIQVYSNDKYKSVEHRVVVNKNTDRYSFPLSFNPAHWVNVSPIPQLLDEEHPPRYKPINWGKYIKSRLEGSYKNLGVENVQISHFAINT